MTKYQKKYGHLLEDNPAPLKHRSLEELLKTKSLPIFVKGRKIAKDRLDVYDFLNLISVRRNNIPNRYWNTDNETPELVVTEDEAQLQQKNSLKTRFILVGRSGTKCRITATAEEDTSEWRRDDKFEHNNYNDVYECEIEEFINLLAETRVGRDDTSRIKEMYILIKDNLRLEDLLFTDNMEIRSELVKRMGFEGISEYCTVLDTLGDYILVDLKYGDIVFGRYMRMVDSTSREQYLLRVPTHRDFGRLKIPIDTCKKALAWSFKVQEKDYKPEIET